MLRNISSEIKKRFGICEDEKISQVLVIVHKIRQDVVQIQSVSAMKRMFKQYQMDDARPTKIPFSSGTI